MPNLPPGTLPPVILPYDPTSTTPVCLVALDSDTQAGVDPVRHWPLRGPQHDHGHSRRQRSGRVRRQVARHPRLPGPREDAGPQPLAAGRDARHRQVQHLPAHRRRQVRQDRLRPRLQLDVRTRRSDGRHSRQIQGRPHDLPQGRGQREGRQLAPDERRARQRPAAGLHPGLPPGRRQHAWRSSNDLQANSPT